MKYYLLFSSLTCPLVSIPHLFHLFLFLHFLLSQSPPSSSCPPSLLFIIQTSNPGNAPFSSLQDYQKWGEFLSSELQAINKSSSEGGVYEGAQALLSAFQTSEYWVRINLEAIAISGSIYGIILSFILCSLVVVFLSHDFRLVVTMALTVVAILLALCGLFWCFSWTIGIVEAISLSILVGNSLDYCIHMSEAYMTTDRKHLAYVDQFKVHTCNMYLCLPCYCYGDADRAVSY